jgi:predicted CXXCH cytochrome family protein
MSKKIYLLTVSLVSLLLIMKTGIVLSEEAASVETQSVHQRASICLEDFEVTFPDEPLICQDVCDLCHEYEIVVPAQSANPEGLTTTGVYALNPGDEDVLVRAGLLQKSCNKCHSGKKDPDTNHPVSVEHMANSSEMLKETELKLFDGKIECITCHSPHSGNLALLSLPNQGSALCIDCHTL